MLDYIGVWLVYVFLAEHKLENQTRTRGIEFVRDNISRFEPKYTEARR